MRAETMSKWLKTRQQLYLELDYRPYSPYLSPEVVSWLNTEVGLPALLSEQPPFPIWTVRSFESFDLHQIRNFLARYSLTAYEGYGGWTWDIKGTVCESSFFIAPRVPESAVERLNKHLGLMGEGNDRTPCFTWHTSLKSIEEAEILLQEIKGLLNQYLVIPHLTVEIATQPISEWSFGPEVYEEYYQVFNISLAPSGDKFNLLRFYELDGANYDFYTEDIIKELMWLDIKYGVDYFVMVDELQLKHIPEGTQLLELEEWFGNFCPDLANEPEAVEALSRGRVKYWWD